MTTLSSGNSTTFSLSPNQSVTVTSSPGATGTIKRTQYIEGTSSKTDVLGPPETNQTYGPYGSDVDVELTSTSGDFTYVVNGNPYVSAVVDDPTGGINGLAAQNGKNLGVTIGVVPSGDTTGATDVANINAALASAGRVILSQDADYYVNAPIVLNAYYTLAGYATMGNTLEGQGIGSTRIRQVGTNFPVIRKDSLGIACNVKGVTLLGADASGADSCGIFSNQTGGGNYFDDIFIQGFKAGVRLHDNTLTSFKNLQIRACDIGVQFGWQADIMLFQNCRIQECTTAGISNGWTDATHHNGSVTSNNCIHFIASRFGKNTVTCDWNDYDSTGLIFNSCYFEDETKLMWLGSAAMTTSTPKKVLFTDCHIEYPTTTPSGTLIEMRNPYTATSDISLVRVQCQYTLGSGVRYLKAGINTSIFIDKCILPQTNGHITYYTGAAQSYDIQLSNTGSAFPTVTYTSNTQHVNYTDGAAVGSNAAAVMLMTSGTDKIFEQWQRIAANTGLAVNTNNCQVMDIAGKWVLYKGAVCIQTPDSLPTASATYRGVMAYQSGGAGVADTVVCCMKNAADTYTWKTVIAG